VQTNPLSDEVLIRYLLGELTEAERDHVEESYFANEKVNERLMMLEDAMLDAYVRGQLPLDVRDRCSRLAQASTEQRRRVEFAEALRRMVAQQVSSPGRRTWRDVVREFWFQRPARQLALAAAGVVAIIAGSLIYYEKTWRTHPPAQQSATTSPQPAIKHLAPTPQPAIPVLAFTLSPLERSGGKENRVAIPAGTYTIRLRLDLEDCGAQALRATIRTAEGAAVARLDGLRPQSIGSGACAVFLSLPSGRLRGNAYSVRLNRLAADGATELVGGYTFRVEHER
jgi:anti-sigma factor RsiW